MDDDCCPLLIAHGSFRIDRLTSPGPPMLCAPCFSEGDRLYPEAHSVTVTMGHGVPPPISLPLSVGYPATTEIFLSDYLVIRVMMRRTVSLRTCSPLQQRSRRTGHRASHARISMRDGSLYAVVNVVVKTNEDPGDGRYMGRT